MSDEEQLVKLNKPKLNWRLRFWRWVWGETEPVFTESQMKEVMEHARAHLQGDIYGTRSFQIVDAMNGKIIKFRNVRDEFNRVGSSRLEPNGERYYLVPEGKSLMEAIASIIAADKIK